jgi:hypothetical protein
MIDTFLAILGRKHCGWCNYKDTNLVERLIGADKYLSEQNRWQRAACWVYTRGGLGIWRAGQWWHWRFHVENDPNYDPCEGHS